MHNQKFYRKPWTKDLVKTLIRYWPHFGTHGMASILTGISRKQIKAKINKLKIKLLPKKKRLCMLCKKRHQYCRTAGLKCRVCYLSGRKDLRQSQKYTFDDWMKEMARSCRYRNRTIHNTKDTISHDMLEELWKKQHGKCYYSQLKMFLPEFKKDRNYLSASIDRKDSNKGYTLDNIVWCCWACNCGKNNFNLRDYLSICEAVVLNKNQLSISG